MSHTHVYNLMIFSAPKMNNKRLARGLEKLPSEYDYELFKKAFTYETYVFDPQNTRNAEDPFVEFITRLKFLNDIVELHTNGIRLEEHNEEFVLPKNTNVSLHGAILLFRPNVTDLVKMTAFAHTLTTQGIPVVWCEDKYNTQIKYDEQTDEKYLLQQVRCFELKEISRTLINKAKSKEILLPGFEPCLAEQIFTNVQKSLPTKIFSFSFDNSPQEITKKYDMLNDIVYEMTNVKEKWSMMPQESIFTTTYAPIYFYPTPFSIKN